LCTLETHLGQSDKGQRRRLDPLHGRLVRMGWRRLWLGRLDAEGRLVFKRTSVGCRLPGPSWMVWGRRAAGTHRTVCPIGPHRTLAAGGCS
jgi:hypothetical protein